MANLDSNQWYQIHLHDDGDRDRSLLGTNLFKNSRTGAVFMNKTQTSQSTQRWQIYPLNSSTSVLRTKEGGKDAFLGALYAPDEPTPGHTHADMVRGNISDDSVYWTITPWGDGTFYMTNAVNDTRWHLGVNSAGLIVMDSNITGTQNGQRWSYDAIVEINDKAFSSVSLPGFTSAIPSATAASTSATASITAAPTTANSSTSSTTHTNAGPSNPKGLTTGAKAGIGIALALVALIILLLLALFFLRRGKERNKKQNPYEADGSRSFHELSQGGDSLKFEMTHESVRYEANNESANRSEMLGWQEQMYELPNESARVAMDEKKWHAKGDHR